MATIGLVRLQLNRSKDGLQIIHEKNASGSLIWASCSLRPAETASDKSVQSYLFVMIEP
jgi:hypothetical protein